MGRITLNPLRHLDPFGFIMLIIVGFGWAKPVPINPRNFRNPKSGMAVSALAGPVSNLLMAFGGLIILNIIIVTGVNAGEFIHSGGSLYSTDETSSFIRAALTFFNQFATLNVSFAVFILIPIPPLDGSRIVNYFLPPRLSYYYSFVERYGFIILMVLIYTRILTTPLIFIAGLILGAMSFVLEPLFNLFM
jgi:Zn-dependent protease